MITNEDMLSYFSELEIMEKNMFEIYSESIKQISDETVMKILKQLLTEEAHHRHLVNEIRKIILKKTI